MSKPRPKVIHRGAKISPEGHVSALCFDPPRPINLAIQTWTIRDASVTCPKCKRAMKAASAETEEKR